MQKSCTPRTELARVIHLWCGICLCALQLLSGCGPASHDHDHDHSDAGDDVTLETTSENGTYRVSYRAEPETIPFNDTFELHTEIVRVDGTNLLEDVDVQVDAGMPSHNHGMNTAAITIATPDGTFHTTGMLFHMEGRWEITVDITENGTTDRAIFQVDVAP